GGVSLEDGAHVVRLVHFLCRHPTHDHSPAAGRDGEALGLEYPERLPDGGSADPELRRELPLGQPRVGRKNSGENGASEARVDLPRGRCGRWKRLEYGMQDTSISGIFISDWPCSGFSASRLVYHDD